MQSLISQISEIKTVESSDKIFSSAGFETEMDSYGIDSDRDMVVKPAVNNENQGT